MTSKVEDFWKFINARHAIYLKRKDKQPKPWSDEPIFQEWKFTNVFRELDRGTIALRRMLRTLYKQLKGITVSSEDDIRIVCRNYLRNQFITCILYRMFNWHENAKYGPITNQTAWWHYLRQEQSIGNKIFGDAFTLPSYKGEEKLVTFERVGREIVSDADDLISEIQEHNTLKYAAELLSEYPHIGPFIAYEFVCDLRYTDILRDATDVTTWCNIGPGADRGLERMGLTPHIMVVKDLYEQSLGSLQEDDLKDLIETPQAYYHWIHDHFGKDSMYPYWELREIEHCLGEFDKYERIRLGQGRPKDKFDGVK